MSRKKFLLTDEENKKGLCRVKNVSDVLENNITEYGLSVIEDRTIPSVRDGLKPAQRRLIKALYDMKCWNTSPTVKSARVLGDTMGKYHPHSEAYGALKTLVNQSYSLVQGQGNWGGIDDEAAAPRYTECKFSKLGQKCMESYCVAEEVPNFSGEYMEPVDFTYEFPAFFVNGGEGVGVAIRFEIPDHNLEEVVAALKYVLKKGDRAKMAEMMQVFHGPDCTTGGKLLTSPDELIQVYENGKGRICYECDYEVKQVGKKSYLLNVTGYCPKWKPSSFQEEMIKLMDKRVDGEKMIQYANDASTKENPCNFEVLFYGENTFEDEIHKHLRTSQPVQYYALDRSLSKTPEIRDVDTKLLNLGLIDYMKIWIDWRRKVEAQLLSVEKKTIEDKIMKDRCRCFAAEKLDVIKKSLESDDPVEYLTGKIPFLKGSGKEREGAEYVLDFKLSALKKIDISKVQKQIESNVKELGRIADDMKSIDKVIAKKLDGLKEFFKPRKLKIF